MERVQVAAYTGIVVKVMIYSSFKYKHTGKVAFEAVIQLCVKTHNLSVFAIVYFHVINDLFIHLVLKYLNESNRLRAVKCVKIYKYRMKNIAITFSNLQLV